MYEKLMKQVQYAKKTVIPMYSLYETYGAIKMAFELKAITQEEYFELNHACVADGINNSKYF